MTMKNFLIGELKKYHDADTSLVTTDEVAELETLLLLPPASSRGGRILPSDCCSRALEIAELLNISVKTKKQW